MPFLDTLLTPPRSCTCVLGPCPVPGPGSWILLCCPSSLAPPGLALLPFSSWTVAQAHSAASTSVQHSRHLQLPPEDSRHPHPTPPWVPTHRISRSQVCSPCSRSVGKAHPYNLFLSLRRQVCFLMFGLINQLSLQLEDIFL